MALHKCLHFLIKHTLFLFSGLIFYDTKVTVMNRVLNATVQRTADHAAPEITLDPLEIVGGMDRKATPLHQLNVCCHGSKGVCVCVQVRSTPQRTLTSARQPGSCLVSPHLSCVSSLQVEETPLMPSTSDSLGKRSMALVSVQAVHTASSD